MRRSEVLVHVTSARLLFVGRRTKPLRALAAVTSRNDSCLDLSAVLDNVRSTLYPNEQISPIGVFQHQALPLNAIAPALVSDRLDECSLPDGNEGYGISLQRGLGWLAVCPAEAVPYLYQAPLRSRIGPFDTIEVKRRSTANFVSDRLRPARSTTAPQTTLPIAPASTTDRCLCDPVGVSQLPRIGYYALATAEYREP